MGGTFLRMALVVLSAVAILPPCFSQNLPYQNMMELRFPAIILNRRLLAMYY